MLDIPVASFAEKREASYPWQDGKTDGKRIRISDLGQEQLRTGDALTSHRRAFTDVMMRTLLPVRSLSEYTQPRDLTAVKREGGTEVHVRVHPCDVQVAYFTMAKQQAR
jgi:hypothetical protein